MTIEFTRRLALGTALLLLAGCEHGLAEKAGAAKFGEPNRQTMLAQVVDPDPQYEGQPLETSGDKAGDAAERYRTDKVKRPERVRSTSGAGGSSGGGN
jgi:hypothetical protein